MNNYINIGDILYYKCFDRNNILSRRLEGYYIALEKTNVIFLGVKVWSLKYGTIRWISAHAFEKYNARKNKQCLKIKKKINTKS